jgi:hypothetical protein
MGPPAGRNRLINGGFSIDQRNAGASQTFAAAAAIAYTVDRWYASCTGANISGQRVAGSSNPFAYKFTGAASNTGGLFGQRIESFNVADFVSGNVVCSLQAKSSSITTLTWTAYCASSADTFSSKTQIATGTLPIGSALASYNFTFNAGANAANGIAIEFSWGALTAGNTIQFEAVQFESGTTPTVFEWRQYREKMADCERYYEALQAVTTYQSNSVAGANNACAGSATWKTKKRAAPTVTISNYSSIQASGFGASSTVDILNYQMTPTVGGSTCGASFTATASCEL